MLIIKVLKGSQIVYNLGKTISKILNGILTKNVIKIPYNKVKLDAIVFINEFQDGGLLNSEK